MYKRFIGDRAFYSRVFRIVIPIIIQSGITNFVSMLDNIMVGQVGTVPMSGVSIMNQLIFVFYLCVFGAASGAGIFTAQFKGSSDNKGIGYTFRYKLLTCLVLSVGAVSLFLWKGDVLAGLYLTGEGDPAQAAQTLDYGMGYLMVMLWGLLPFSLCNAYSSTLRETGQTMVPMAAGICAVFVNLILNYILIFGHFGAPQMGVQGAALATVISRFVELGICIFWTHRNTDKNPWAQGVYHSPAIPLQLAKNITVKGMPLLVNELLWSVGMATLNQCYSTCGLDVVPAQNISATLVNLSSVVYFSMGSAVGILMGQMLGAKLPEKEVRQANTQLIFLSTLSGIVFALLMVGFSGIFPRIYNTSDEIRALAASLICISACMMPIHSFLHATYFTLRSGGQTFVTFLFDSGFMWACSVPLAFCLSRFTALPILPLYTICQSVDILKCLLGYYLLKKGTWVQNLT